MLLKGFRYAHYVTPQTLCRLVVLFSMLCLFCLNVIPVNGKCYTLVMPIKLMLCPFWPFGITYYAI